ncbi:hypothetical protein ACFQX7_10485 [Luedemannella flava]
MGSGTVSAFPDGGVTARSSVAGTMPAAASTSGCSTKAAGRSVAALSAPGPDNSRSTS